MSKLMVTCYRYGLPSIFFTFAPDDIHGVLNLRLSIPEQFTPVFQLLIKVSSTPFDKERRILWIFQ